MGKAKPMIVLKDKAKKGSLFKVKRVLCNVTVFYVSLDSVSSYKSNFQYTECPLIKISNLGFWAVAFLLT